MRAYVNGFVQPEATNSYVFLRGKLNEFLHAVGRVISKTANIDISPLVVNNSSRVTGRSSRPVVSYSSTYPRVQNHETCALYEAIGYYSNFLSQQLQLDCNNSEQCLERFTRPRCVTVSPICYRKSQAEPNSSAQFPSKREPCSSTTNPLNNWISNLKLATKPTDTHRSMYDIWMPNHLKRICSAVDQMLSDVNFDVSESDLRFSQQSNAPSESLLHSLSRLKMYLKSQGRARADGASTLVRVFYP